MTVLPVNAVELRLHEKENWFTLAHALYEKLHFSTCENTVMFCRVFYWVTETCLTTRSAVATPKQAPRSHARF